MQNKEQVIHCLTEHKKNLIARRAEMFRPLQQIDLEIEHVSATIASLQKASVPSPNSEALADFPVSKLRGLTQVQALVVIAKQNQGIVRAQEAKRLLIRAGVMRETKNSTNVIHSVILRSEKFERVRPGEYRLREIGSNGQNHPDDISQLSLGSSKPF